MKNKLTKLALAGATAVIMSCSNSITSPQPEPQYPTEPSSSSLYVAPSSSSIYTPEPQSSSSQYEPQYPTEPSSSSEKSTPKSIDDYIDEYCELEAICVRNNDNCWAEMEEIINSSTYEGKREEGIKKHINNIKNIIDHDCGLSF